MIDNRYTDLIASFLSGDISAEEYSTLMTWVEESEENKAAFEESQKVWSITGNDDFSFEMDVDEAWGAVASQLETPTEKKATPSIQTKDWSIGNYLFRVAAVILITIIAGYWLYQNQSPIVSELTSIITQAGEKQELTLPDGSKVWINEQSRLSYHPDFQPRKVFLEGEAFFEVENLNDASFEILSGDARTVVLGTAFNVRAYPAENQIEVTVEHGKVAVNLQANKAAPILLKAGNTGVVNKTSKDLSKKEQKVVNAASWKTKQLTFENMRMAEVIESLERYFGIIIEVDDERILNCHFTGNYQNPELKQILDVLKFGLALDIDNQPNSYLFSGEGC